MGILETKKCTKCTNEKPINSFYTTGKKVSGDPKYNSWCKKCVKTKMSEYHLKLWGDGGLHYTAFKRTKTVRNYLSYLRSKAKQRRKCEDIISLNDLEFLWESQRGICALTGWPMTFELAKGVINTNCSIDRINSKIGYISGNVQLVCRIANVAKADLNTSDFINLCKSVLETSNGKNTCLAA